MALCGDDADVREHIRHAVSVALMLVNTADFCATTSCLELVPGLMLCPGDATGGEAQARERRMATEARVCLTRHSTADRSVIQAGAAVAEVSIAIGVHGWAFSL